MFSGNGHERHERLRRGAQHRQRIQSEPARARRPPTRPRNLGNYTGYPAFVAPRDPRPGSDGPATFLRDANFGLQRNLGRHQQRPGQRRRPAPTSWATPRTPTRPRQGLPPAGIRPPRRRRLRVRAPRDPGHHGGRRGLPRGHDLAGARMEPRVANGSHALRLPRAELGDGRLLRPVDKATVKATDLVLSGSDINPLSRSRRSSVTWLDNHTAQFNLTGQFNPPARSTSSLHVGLDQEPERKPASDYSDKVVLNSVTPAPTPTPDADSHADPDTDSHAGTDAAPRRHRHRRRSRHIRPSRQPGSRSPSR